MPRQLITDSITFDSGGGSGGGAMLPQIVKPKTVTDKADTNDNKSDATPTTDSTTPTKKTGGGTTNTPVLPDVPAPEKRDSAELLNRITGGDAEPAAIDRAGKYDKTEQVNLLNQQIEAARGQYTNNIDRSTDQATTELRRALEDAQGQYQTQQNQISADEAVAKDNAALHAEARGDKGGIGQAQYTSIQNTAAQNRQAVNTAQIKLATDTSRQIADLRAQGEYDKADAMLDLTQSYLSELRGIEEYAANYNLNVDQINTAIAEWEAEYARSMQQFKTSTELSLANLTGEFADGTPTVEALNATNQAMAGLAMSLIEAGMTADKLTVAQRQALQSVYGMDAAQLAAYTALQKKSGGTSKPVVNDDDYLPGLDGDGPGGAGKAYTQDKAGVQAYISDMMSGGSKFDNAVVKTTINSAYANGVISGAEKEELWNKYF
jgi:hypothetical protein